MESTTATPPPVQRAKLSRLTSTSTSISAAIVFGILAFLVYRRAFSTSTMTSTALRFLTVPARGKHTATVIFLHGLGDTGSGWEPVATMLARDPALQHIKWMLPHAPQQKVTANFGMVMPSWFDILSFDWKSAEDEKGLLESTRKINELVTAEVDAGIPANRVVVGGFSQGAVISLFTGLTGERKFGGVVALSGWVPLASKFKSMSSAHASSTPVFWGHGADDPLVPLALGIKSSEFLVNGLGLSKVTKESTETAGLSWNVYQGLEHSASQPELDDLQAWIKKVIPAEPSTN